MIVFCAFFIFLFLSLLQSGFLKKVLQRNLNDWVLDLVNLGVQGLLIPFLQVCFTVAALHYFLPKYSGVLDWHPVIGFFINFIVIDYLYYWNHRALHSNKLWSLHAVHHSATNLDLFMTSRNSVWSSFFIVYFWLNSVLIFLFKDPSGVILGASITAVLDIWRHTDLWASSKWTAKLGMVFITPCAHHWHHSRNTVNCNFGANLIIWDHLHGTAKSTEELPVEIGAPLEGNGPRLIYPLFSKREV